MIIKNDVRIKTILNPISNRIKMAAIFGSYLKQPKIANDIDLALWIDSRKFDLIKNELKRYNCFENMFVEPLMCTYVKLPDQPSTEDENDIPPIHINILPNDKKIYSKSAFWIRNKDKMKFII